MTQPALVQEQEPWGRVNEEIVLVLTTGRQMRIAPPIRFGQYAAHPRVRSGEMSGPGWTVTHVGTGCLIWHVETESEAIQVAAWLDQNGPRIPEGKTEAQQWRQQLSASERTKLIAQLQQIAPRQP